MEELALHSFACGSHTRGLAGRFRPLGNGVAYGGLYFRFEHATPGKWQTRADRTAGHLVDNGIRQLGQRFFRVEQGHPHRKVEEHTKAALAKKKAAGGTLGPPKKLKGGVRQGAESESHRIEVARWSFRIIV